MPKYVRKMTLLAKAETTFQTDATPTAALNAIRAYDVSLVPLEGDEVKNPFIKPHFGADTTVQVTAYKSMTFFVPLSGVATAGASPGVTDLLRMCATSVTTAAGVKTTFAPISSGLESGTIYANIDGIKHVSLGVRGNAEITVDAKGLPAWKFDLKGSFVPLVDEALPTGVVYTRFLTQLPVNKTNTTLTLDGISVAASSFSLNMGLQVNKEDLINVDEVDISGRESTASVTFRSEALSVRDWVGLHRTRTQVAMVLTHGQAATNKVRIAAPRAEIGKPSYGDSNGMQMITLPLRLIPSDSGNDEWSIEI